MKIKREGRHFEFRLASAEAERFELLLAAFIDTHPDRRWAMERGIATRMLNKLRAARRSDGKPDRFDRSNMPWGEGCACGHAKRDHIYEEGACRPGFRCECEQFRRTYFPGGIT